jgi:hypothetical protein
MQKDDGHSDPTKLLRSAKKVYRKKGALTAYQMQARQFKAGEIFEPVLPRPEWKKPKKGKHA